MAVIVHFKTAGFSVQFYGSTIAVLHQWVEFALKGDRARRAVILIDQFEETFTQVAKESERAAFLNLLKHTASIETGRVTIVLAMGSDFVSNSAAYPQLNDLPNRPLCGWAR